MKNIVLVIRSMQATYRNELEMTIYLFIYKESRIFQIGLVVKNLTKTHDEKCAYIHILSTIFFFDI